MKRENSFAKQLRIVNHHILSFLIKFKSQYSCVDLNCILLSCIQCSHQRKFVSRHHYHEMQQVQSAQNPKSKIPNLKVKKKKSSCP
jgi:hypothetical protein